MATCEAVTETAANTIDFDAPPEPGQASCDAPGCTRGLWWSGRGKRTTLCDRHAPNPRRHNPERALVPVPAAASRQMKTRGAKDRADARFDIASRAWAVRRLAVGLGMTDDVREAARLAGVMIDEREPTDDELDELHALALADDLQPLREGRPTETAAMTARFLALNSISLLEQESLLTAQQRPNAARMAQQVLDALGGGKIIWPEVHVHLGAPRDDAAKEKTE